MISIVITTMGDLSSLVPCIESIIKYTDLTNKEVIIVANGCKDKSLALLDYVGKLSDPFVLVYSHKPLGFSGANNAGIRQAQGDYIILLNDDVVLLEHTKDYWIALLLEPFVDSTVGLTATMRFTFDCRGTIRQAVAFWCVMIKREVFDKIGLLDEVFNPFGCEDIDFSIRATNAGYRLVQVPNDTSHEFLKGKPTMFFPIWHRGSKTTDSLGIDKQAQEQTNMNIIYDRYGK